MNPEVSRAIASIKDRLELSPGPVLDELLATGATAETPDDLPIWARNVLALIDQQPAP